VTRSCKEHHTRVERPTAWVECGSPVAEKIQARLDFSIGEFGRGDTSTANRGFAWQGWNLARLIAARLPVSEFGDWIFLASHLAHP
jgi:hypothetical protein